MQQPTCLEICAGAGGQALGFEQAGINHVGFVEIQADACSTLLLNRPHWNVIQADINEFDARHFRDVDLLAGGLPCPPFSVAGRQLGDQDERNLFPAMLRLIHQTRPRAVMIENVRGILDPVFDEYREAIKAELTRMGYKPEWKLLNACRFGVPQLRPRAILVAIAFDLAEHFSWPATSFSLAPSVGEVLYDLMASRGWKEVEAWKVGARDIAPTIVGGSLKHGGPDLGPTRAKQAWARLGVDGHGIADDPPGKDFSGIPRLTVRMVARLQGFPDTWQFSGAKTAAYRQVGNAFPPPVARAIAESLKSCLNAETTVAEAG